MFLELSIGNLYAAIAVSILMVGVAVVVLVLTRLFGLRAHWDTKLINDVEDVFGQQWVR